jgi:hypothetical protein
VSEYQYYEFQALDKPLTKQQQKELRSLSSRAEITATSFVNEYSYGDFRGQPQKLMERYFDAFCYLANWGTRRPMFRLPKTVLDAQAARRYCHSDAASVTETAEHVIIDLCLERDPDDEWLEGSGLLAGMVQARSDLAAGDLRLLYLAWLLGIRRADEDDDDDVEDETEPPVPAGLGELSAPLEAIAEFLEIHEDLLAVAAEASPQAGESLPGALAAWVLTLPATEKDTLLTMLASGQGTQAQALLLRRFRDTTATADHSASARRAAELLEAADARMLERKRAEEERCREQQRRQAAAKAAAHAKRLDDLAAEGDAPWKRVDEMIAAKKTSEYDLAVFLLRDLREVAERQDEAEQFSKRVLGIRERYSNRPALQERLDKAKMPRAAGGSK